MANFGHHSYPTLLAFAVLVLGISECPWTWVPLSPCPCPSLSPHFPLIHGFWSLFLVSRHQTPPPHTHTRRVPHSLTHCGK